MTTERLFGYWVLFTALTISVVAAYYSIVGLTAIFAAAVIPVVIMGASLEIAKVTTAIWLHTYWQDTGFLMKSYLTSATIVLMVITSMGIFGFLSKAHIEQSANTGELSAQVERIDTEISRFESVIERANRDLAQIDTRGVNDTQSLQGIIDSQTQQIESIRTALAADIELARGAIEPLTTSVSDAQASLEAAEADAAQLAGLLEQGDVQALQAFVGAGVDGNRGPETNRLIAERQASIATQVDNASERLEIARARAAPEVERVNEEIAQLRAAADTAIAEARDAIDEVRDRLVNVTTEDRSADRAALEARINEATAEIDALYERRFDAETTLRQLAVEVGPVRYIAELIYGETSTDLLEQAVRWVILILVFVFDPLAIVLVLAGVTILHQTKPKRRNSEPTPTPDSEPIVNDDTDSTPLVAQESEIITPPVTTDNDTNRPPAVGRVHMPDIPRKNGPGFEGNDVEGQPKSPQLNTRRKDT